MESIPSQLYYFLEAIVFATLVLLHLSKKNALAIWVYVAQAGVVALLLALTSIEKMSWLLAVSLGATILVKILIAPTFFFRLIKRHQLKFSASTYLNTPTTLIVIAALVAVTQRIFVGPITTFGLENKNLLFIAAAGIFVSIFLLINRKGTLSQMLGVLSLENCIVSFVIFAGLEQSPSLQLGIIFDLLIWTLVASIFSSMIYKQFGTLDVTEMKGLTE